MGSIDPSSFRGLKTKCVAISALIPQKASDRGKGRPINGKKYSVIHEESMYSSRGK